MSTETPTPKPQPVLSILIGAIPDRFDAARSLYERLMADKGDRNIQIILLMDNRVMSIGEKRDWLVQIAAGKYIIFIDDDEDFFPGYCEYMYNACLKEPDVVTFMQKCTYNGVEFTVNFDLNNPVNEEVPRDKKGKFVAGSTVNRRPFHVCGWRSELAKSVHFPPVGYSEDWHWAKQVLEKCQTQHKIPGYMHHYIFDKNITAAPTESNEVWKNPNDPK